MCEEPYSRVVIMFQGGGESIIRFLTGPSQVKKKKFIVQIQKSVLNENFYPLNSVENSLEKIN